MIKTLHYWWGWC